MTQEAFIQRFILSRKIHPAGLKNVLSVSILWAQITTKTFLSAQHEIKGYDLKNNIKAQSGNAEIK